MTSDAVPPPAPPPAAPRRVSLGLGLTNECNLSCAFCYRDPARVDRLEPDAVCALLDRLPVASVNLGTGENGLHPEFGRVVAELRRRPIKLTMTSNGHSVAVASDDELGAFADIELSLDHPTQGAQDAQRGAGSWELVHAQAARCRRLGVPVTFVAVMMSTNFDRLAEVAEVAKAYDAPLRVNVYQAVRTGDFALDYAQYWLGFETLLARTDVIAIGEPLVRAMAGLPPREGGCGVATIRVTPRGTVLPCVYWPDAGVPLRALVEAGVAILDSEPFADARSLPEACRGCAYVAACRGGCAGRRRLHGALSEPDVYCPVVRGEARALAVRMAPRRELPKLESACTTIVIAR